MQFYEVRFAVVVRFAAVIRFAVEVGSFRCGGSVCFAVEVGSFRCGGWFISLWSFCLL